MSACQCFRLFVLVVKYLLETEQIFVPSLTGWLMLIKMMLLLVLGLSARNGFKVLQNHLFSVTSLRFKLLNWYFWIALEDLSNSYVNTCTQTNCQYFFSYWDLFVIALGRDFDIIGWLLLFTVLCSRGINWFQVNLNARWNDSKNGTRNNCIFDSFSIFSWSKPL